MQFVSPLFWTQLRMLKLHYGTLVSVFFLLFHGGEISAQNLKLWDTTLSILYKVQKWITWIAILVIIAYAVWVYGVAVFLAVWSLSFTPIKFLIEGALYTVYYDPGLSWFCGGAAGFFCFHFIYEDSKARI